jgi:hypothetical protein
MAVPARGPNIVGDPIRRTSVSHRNRSFFAHAGMRSRPGTACRSTSLRFRPRLWKWILRPWNLRPSAGRIRVDMHTSAADIRRLQGWEAPSMWRLSMHERTLPVVPYGQGVHVGTRRATLCVRTRPAGQTLRTLVLTRAPQTESTDRLTQKANDLAQLGTVVATPGLRRTGVSQN